MKKKIIILSSLVILVLIAVYLYVGRKDDAEAAPVGQYTYVVKVARGDLNLVVSANGVVQPINKVEIKSKASGQIEELSFIEGQTVEKGQLLLRLDQRVTKNNVEQAQADLAVAEANLQQQANADHRAKELFDKGLSSQLEWDAAHLDYVRAQSQLVKAKATLATSEDQLRDTRIVAPITGVILTKDVELGQIISSGVSNVGGGTLIATIADMNRVYVNTNVDEVDIGKVSVGQRATVTADAYPEDKFIGTVERIDPMGKTTQNVTTFNVVVLVNNQGGKLKAGMSASVDIEIFNQQNVLLVPNEALKDPRSAQGREIMTANNLTVPVDSSARTTASRGEGGGPGGRFQNMSDEERQKMRERFQNMSQEERDRMRQQFMQRMQAQGGMAGAEGGGGEGFMRFRRQRSAEPEREVRYRIVTARNGDGFKPKIIKVGPSNFDQTVILDGLDEGQEVEITTISRAKIAQEQMNERMRSMNSLGGSSTRNAQRATGTGGRR